jgi:hypothetical protein
MLIEYVVFGALIVMVLVATLVGMRRRRADLTSADPAATFPYIGDGSAGAEVTHHPGHAELDGSPHGGGGFDGGGGSHGGGGFDGAGGSHEGGGFDGGGGHND